MLEQAEATPRSTSSLERLTEAEDENHDHSILSNNAMNLVP
jgi:hypothetical protein